MRSCEHMVGLFLQYGQIVLKEFNDSSGAFKTWALMKTTNKKEKSDEQNWL